MKEGTKEKFLFHDTVISWACIIWAVASVGLMMYFFVNLKLSLLKSKPNSCLFL